MRPRGGRQPGPRPAVLFAAGAPPVLQPAPPTSGPSSRPRAPVPGQPSPAWAAVYGGQGQLGLQSGLHASPTAARLSGGPGREEWLAVPQTAPARREPPRRRAGGHSQPSKDEPGAPWDGRRPPSSAWLARPHCLLPRCPLRRHPTRPASPLHLKLNRHLVRQQSPPRGKDSPRALVSKLNQAGVVQFVRDRSSGGPPNRPYAQHQRLPSALARP